MKTIFYAPMKSPAKSPMDETPSGDQTMANLLIRALKARRAEIVMLEGAPLYHSDPEDYQSKKQSVQNLWAEISGDILKTKKPDLWVTYHSYYKSPDLFGPLASKQFDVPYAIFEPSYAPNKRETAWAGALADAKRSFDRADLLFVMKRKDWHPLKEMLGSDDKLVRFPPFIDPAPFTNAVESDVRARQGIPAETPIILCTAMMRAGAKRTSYAFLAQALKHLGDCPWHLLVVGDGPARTGIEADFEALAPRVTFLGKIAPSNLPPLYAAADLFAWPGIGEAYGMVYLEAAASGLPAVAVDGPGVGEVIRNGQTGFLTDPVSVEAYAEALHGLLTSTARRNQTGQAARAFAVGDGSIAARIPHLDPLFKLVEEQ